MIPSLAQNFLKFYTLWIMFSVLSLFHRKYQLCFFSRYFYSVYYQCIIKASSTRKYYGTQLKTLTAPFQLLHNSIWKCKKKRIIESNRKLIKSPFNRQHSKIWILELFIEKSLHPPNCDVTWFHRDCGAEHDTK